MLRKKYRPGFDKYGGHYHLCISTVADLEYLISLPDGRWMATSCPLFGINLDPAFLKFLDADGNNRIVSNELRAAVRWLLKCLHTSETWTEHRSVLPLNLISTDSPEGKDLKDAANLILKNLNLPDAIEISLEQVRNRQKIMAQADYNGDGVIPPEVVKDAETGQFVRDLMATVGSVPDASGLKGINEALLDQFKKEANSYLQWYDQGMIPEDQNETGIMPFNTSTPGMFQAITVVREKIDQFFAQCALVRFDPRMAERMMSRYDEIAKLDYRDKQAIMEHLSLAPIAKPKAEGLLPLDDNINEFYRNSVKALREQVVKPILGESIENLSETQWHDILCGFAAYEKWLKAKPAVTIEPLGVEKNRSHVNSAHDSAIRCLIVEDKAVAGEIQQLQNLEKLVLYHQWLFEFVNNYVSLPHLFNTEAHAVFEVGTLILGGREFNFSVKVENRLAHSNLAKNSGIFLLYIQITGAKPEDAFEIAVPVTRGSARDFYVGKRGVFFTIAGVELDAQVTQIVDNPISLWDSAKEPVRRVQGMVGGRISQISTAIQKEAEKGIAVTPADQQIIQKEMQQVQQTTGQSAPVVPAAAMPQSSAVPNAPNTQRSSSTRDLMVGTGLLVAGLGTALKFVVDAAKALAQPKTLRILLIMIGVFLIISILTALISAWRKLRQRDLGILLQASGWAINGQMRLIRPMARIFCQRTRVPKGANKHHRERLFSLERHGRKKQSKERAV